MTEEQRLKRNADSLAYYHAHKDKALARFKRYRARPDAKEKARALNRQWEAANRDKVSARKRKWKKENRETNRRSNRESYARHRVEKLQRARISIEALRLEAIAAFGGHCVCCGETVPRFLAFDHINSDGKKDRQKGGRGKGPHLWGWLKRNNWPKDEFQLLCFNCNMAKMIYGQCPHMRTVQTYLRLVA